MKRKISTLPIILGIMLLALASACKKDDDGQDDQNNNTPTPTPTSTIPSVTTSAVSDLATTTISCGGNVTSDGGASVTARGVCWGSGQTPTIADNKTTNGSGTGSFTSSVTGLSSGTPYYVRAYATNSVGTAYGSAISFTTINNGVGTVSDIDGNVYHTVTIGTQVWFVENLHVTKYRNGDAIPNITDNSQWSNLSSGAYCSYNNNSGVGNMYGYLYNWYAVSDSRNIAPAGWHVPTDAEWTTLVNYLGGATVAGGKMKGTGTAYWANPNVGATNTSGFTALPGGDRINTGTFDLITNYGCWWTATSNNATTSWGNLLYYGDAKDTHSSYEKKCGFSVRCVMD